MTSSTRTGTTSSGATLSCLTGAIVRREGADAVGSNFAPEWDVDSTALLAAPAPTLLRASGPPTPSTAATPSAPMARSTPQRRSRSRRPGTSPRATSLPWSPVGAFALGATIAALAGLGIERGALEVAAVASAVAGGVTLAAALSQAAAKGHADRRRE